MLRIFEEGGIDYSVTLMMTTTMKHLLTLGLLLLLSTTSLLSQDTWVKTFGGSHDEAGTSITTTSDDGILITGRTKSNDGDFKGMNKGGEWDVFVVKHDKDGNVLWKKTLGGSNDDRVFSITTNSDNGILITGYTNSNDGDFKGMLKGSTDIFVIKLDRDGKVLWKKTFGGSDGDRGWSITTTLDGSILITGDTYSNDGDLKGMNKSDADIFVIKLDTDGKVVWNKTFGGSSYDVGNSITTTGDGGILITGHTNSNDGDFEGMWKGGDDIFVVRLDKDGNIQWKKTFGGTDYDLSHSINTTPDDGILVTGYTYSNDGDFKGMNKGSRSQDIFVIKLDTDGKVVWEKTFGGTGSESGHSITTTGDGGILITGYTHSNDGDFKGMNKGRGSSDIFVIKLDRDGKVLWRKTFGGSYSDWGQSITTTEDGDILITGKTYSNDGDFEGMNKGDEDIFVIKLDKDGNLNTKGKKSKKK